MLDKVNVIIPVHDLELLGSEAQLREKRATHKTTKSVLVFQTTFTLFKKSGGKKEVRKEKKARKEATKEERSKERRKNGKKKKELCAVRSNKPIKYIINPHGKRI